jgi:hypothetical protein
MMHDPDIMLSAPSVFAGEPAAAVSRHYKFIPTLQLIDDFRKLGWEVNRAKQQKSHTDPTHTKHMVVLRNELLAPINGAAVELLILNSHNRTTSFNFMLGLFRFICLNGLIVSDKIFDSIKLRHMGGYTFQDLEELTQTIMDNIPSIVGTVNRMQAVTLTDVQQMEFALNAVATRFTEYVSDMGKVDASAINKAIDMPAFLTPYRDEDNDPTVWAVYNRIQEKLTKGGFQRIGTKDNQSKRVRPVTNIKLDVDINKTLWEMANGYTLSGV